jgi:hypothetical protein
MSLTWLLLLLKTIQVARQSVTGIEGVIISAATTRRRCSRVHGACAQPRAILQPSRTAARSSAPGRGAGVADDQLVVDGVSLRVDRGHMNTRLDMQQML